MCVRTHTRTRTRTRTRLTGLALAMLPQHCFHLPEAVAARLHLLMSMSVYTHTLACMHTHADTHPAMQPSHTASPLAFVPCRRQRQRRRPSQASIRMIPGIPPWPASFMYVRVSVAVSLSMLTRLCVYILCMVQCVCVYMYRNILIHKHTCMYA